MALHLSYRQTFSFWDLQLDPPPTEPLYLVSIRGVHLYLREISAIQDIGLNDPSGNGVVPILSESMHYASRTRYTGEGVWHIGGDEAWLDYTACVSCFLFFLSVI